jgi:hypothetical protein
VETAAWLVGHTWRIVDAAQTIFKAPASETLGVIGGEMAAFVQHMHVSSKFGAYLANRASKGRENSLQGCCWRIEVRKGVGQKKKAVGQLQLGLLGAVQCLNKAEISSQGLQLVCTLRIPRNACPANMP